uniref:Uncharacterized protein n=2 Tax=Chrysotila carterae TaxID=13221 RepID=A0A7S4BS13_CHRCT
MKLLIMPALYLALARYFGCSAGDDFLLFLGSLPASASVYALSASRGLSPQIVGPLVPCSIVLCVALVLLPLSPMATSFRAAEALRAAIGAVAVAAALTVCRTNPKKHARD